MLVGGIWVLVDPFHRVGGRTVHLYMTLGAFEAYIWMLLVLGRWQMRKGLAAPAGAGTVETVRFLRDWPYGKGAAMVLGAFALLGMGAGLQWWQQRRLKTKPPPLPAAAGRA